LALLVLASVICPASLLGVQRTITVWLMPSEPADEQPTPPGLTVDAAINQFCLRFPAITILNATNPYLRAQLIAWNQEFAEATWPMLRGQTGTLEALERFAEENGVHIRFRLESWGKAFKDLLDERDRPDLVEVGSTWVAFLAASGKIRFLPNAVSSDDLRWRSVPGLGRASLYYTTDLRLIFYWRRPPSQPATLPAFAPKADNWQDYLDSLENYVVENKSTAMVLPIGMTPNLLHDLVPLVWAGGSHFYLDTWRRHADLTSNEALRVPLMLATRAVVTKEDQPYRVLAFPEMDHEEATRHFMAGDYLAVFEPPAFIRRWFDNFLKREPKPSSPQADVAREREFWSRAGVAVLPETFKGGSDLVVLNGTQVAEPAFSLARFLVQDPQFTGLMGRIGWLPAQLSDHGLAALDASLWHCEPVAGPCQNPPSGMAEFNSALDYALKKGREYPQSAKWPIAFESRQTLDELENLWRAIGEGDQQGVRAAARSAELAVNREIDWLTRLSERTKRWGFDLLLASVPIVWLELHRRKRVAIEQREQARAEAERANVEKERAQAEMKQAQEFQRMAEEKALASEKAVQDERDKNVAMRLLLAEDHMRLHSYVMALQLLGQTTGDGQELRDSLRWHCEHVSHYGHLVTHLIVVLCAQLESPHAGAEVAIGAIAKEAFEGAEAEFTAAFPTRRKPKVGLADDADLQEWEISALPALLVLVLWEWFFNCLKEIPPDTSELQRIEVQVRPAGDSCPDIIIVSPTVIPDPIAILFEEESCLEERTKRGIPLIRELLRWGFKAYARCTSRSSEGKTYLTIRKLPLRRRRAA
jgi:hypothetical protein